MGPVEGWSDFFVATAGASAALAGLVIVAASVNVREIIKHAQLADRAGAAIASLVAILLCSVAGLAQQPLQAFGAEVLAIGGFLWGLHMKSGVATLRMNRERHRPLLEALSVIVLGQLQTLPVIAAGIVLLSDNPAGVIVLFAGFLAMFALTMIDAWVLLIEILR